MTPTKKTATPKDEPEVKEAAKKPAVKKAAPKKAAAAKKPAVKKAAPKKAEEAKAEAPVQAEVVVAKVEAPVAAPVAAAPAVQVKKKLSDAEKGYIYALGRRKTSIAQVRLTLNGKGGVTVNGKKHVEYFPTLEMRDAVLAPLKAVGQDDKVDLVVITYGGGLTSQALAVRLGVSRALLKVNETYRGTLKKLGFLRRDPREKERKKYGLKKARKGPQWAKR